MVWTNCTSRCCCGCIMSLIKFIMLRWRNRWSSMITLALCSYFPRNIYEQTCSKEKSNVGRRVVEHLCSNSLNKLNRHAAEVPRVGGCYKCKHGVLTNSSCVQPHGVEQFFPFEPNLLLHKRNMCLHSILKSYVRKAKSLVIEQRHVKYCWYHSHILYRKLEGEKGSRIKIYQFRAGHTSTSRMAFKFSTWTTREKQKGLLEFLVALSNRGTPQMLIVSKLCFQVKHKSCTDEVHYSVLDFLHSET